MSYKMWMLTLITIFLIIFIYIKFIKPLDYWYKRGIPYVKPWPIVGNMASTVFRMKALAHHLQDIYNKFPDHRYFGYFQFSIPTLVIKDIELIKQICIKDFDSFTDHMEMLPTSSDPFWNKNLFSMTGKHWHAMRCVLSPAFTSSKMKTMFYLMQECSQDFVKYFEMLPDPIILDFKDVFMRVTNDIIASTAFGVKCDSLNYRDNEFYRLGKTMFNFEGMRSLKMFGYSISPFLMKLLKVKIFNDHSQNFFSKLIKETISFREKTGIIRPDMVHLLKEAQKGRLPYDDKFHDIYSDISIEKPIITDDDIVAQALIFFFGGFDTVAIILSHTAFEIAINQNVQDTLIKEVDESLQKCNGQITYDVLLNMKYLDMVLSETLRMWSPAVFINRKSVKPFTIDEKQFGEKPIHLEIGSCILIPVFAIHRDPKYYPNPNKFDPERFNEENKKDIPAGAYIPFGLGPRFCIANRFAILEVKTIIFSLLTKFRIVPVEKTSIPFNLSKKNIMITNDEGYWLGLQHRCQVK